MRTTEVERFFLNKILRLKRMMLITVVYSTKFPSCFSIYFGQNDTLTNTYRLLERTRCLACMAEALKACITASFMQISIVSAWGLRQKRFRACHTGSHVPYSSSAASKKKI